MGLYKKLAVDEFVAVQLRAEELLNDHPSLRYGQAYHIALEFCGHGALLYALSGTNADIFQCDDRDTAMDIMLKWWVE